MFAKEHDFHRHTAFRNQWANKISIHVPFLNLDAKSGLLSLCPKYYLIFNAPHCFPAFSMAPYVARSPNTLVASHLLRALDCHRRKHQGRVKVTSALGSSLDEYHLNRVLLPARVTPILAIGKSLQAGFTGTARYQLNPHHLNS